ncbi:hypothetical protein D9611_009667 [Ephemerocybe angulata]|uniref:Uncharacterized protein n=1 Tax=Ephemerocybe angulata TaxID=980116 RepID=A0A8H5C5Z8_9AGAR|nr:hypothetical protein D9611_009667 [Tulosesus angulatus]
MSDDELGKRVAKFDVNILEEASYILWYIWKERYTGFETLQACISALSANLELYRCLKSAHRCRSYDVIRNWNSSPEPSIVGDAAIDGGVKAFLAEIRPALTRLVAGEQSFAAWSPEGRNFSDEVVQHLASLQIPSIKGKPNLLLHDLGSFSTDDRLRKRLDNIFMPSNHTFLVNTSGSGKTRLLLEGLCQNWGFYFTSLIDSSLLGSSDVQNAINTRISDSPNFHPHLPPAGSPTYEASLERNRKIANRIFRHIFLARLYVFHLFVQTMRDHMACTGTTDTQVYKHRWVFLQLQPSVVHPHVWDVFDELSSKLSKASDAFVNSTTMELLTSVRSLCSGGAGLDAFFCVLDEAQYAATQMQTAFRSDHNAAHRPILREIVRAWESQTSGRGVFMVVAGTGISKDVVDQAMASAIMKDSRYRWCSDTGAFDHEDVQQEYMRKYLPSAYLEGDAGKRLLERVWYWLHGRHRFTAGYVSELLLNGFEQPHALLNAYVHHFSGFTVTDGADFIEPQTEPLPVLSQYKLDFSKLNKREDMLATIHQLSAHYLMRATFPNPLGKDEEIYVEYGFARFVDSETKTVVVDEPLVLLAATHWLNRNSRTCYKYFAKKIHYHDPVSNGFENYIAFCLDMALSKSRLVRDVFTFQAPVPAWANLEAKLVALHRTGMGTLELSPVRHFDFVGPSLTLGVNAKSPEEMAAWLDARKPAAMCFPHTSMGPDMMLVLQLSDGSLVWVAVQTKYSQGRNGSITRPLLKQAMRSVTPSLFYVDKEGNKFCPSSHPDLYDRTRDLLKALPNRRLDAGTCSVLRVIVSFPADTNLKRCINEDPDSEGHPIATLNMDLLKQLTRKMSPVDYLQVLQDPLLKSGVKRKRVPAGDGAVSGSGKRIKLKI